MLNDSIFPLEPDGFWYGIDDEYLRWLQYATVHQYKYEYRVDLGSTAVRRLTCRADVIEFTASFSDQRDGINWYEVARRFAGVELAPYDTVLKSEIHWYHQWHCASGVIWRPSDDLVLTLFGRINRSRIDTVLHRS